jgi:beta-phosphoglucomutase family hydrolase
MQEVQDKPAECGYDAVVFDMDGVVTDTARVHALAWKRLFDEFLRGRAEHFSPFDIERDYARYVDGKPRYEGVRSFLASRGITLPFGAADDSPELETVCGLGNRKNTYFLTELTEGGAQAFPGTVGLVEDLKDNGVKVALVSASRNARQVLEAAGLAGLFEVQVDGVEAASLGLPGKPEPAVFLEAARRLGASPKRTAIVEDSQSGVEAGRRGGFGLVVGVGEGEKADTLRAYGADLVVNTPDIRTALRDMLTGRKHQGES